MRGLRPVSLSVSALLYNRLKAARCSQRVTCGLSSGCIHEIWRRSHTMRHTIRHTVRHTIRHTIDSVSVGKHNIKAAQCFIKLTVCNVSHLNQTRIVPESADYAMFVTDPSKSSKTISIGKRALQSFCRVQTARLLTKCSVGYDCRADPRPFSRLLRCYVPLYSSSVFRSSVSLHSSIKPLYS